MRRLAGLWIVFAVASLAVIVPSTDLNVVAQDGQEATIAALQTEAAGLQTMVALQTEVARLKTQVAAGGGSSPPDTTPTADTDPEPSTVLFAMDDSGGFEAWAGVGGWNEFNGMLVNNGASDAEFTTLYDPGTIVDYAVEAEIQLIEFVGRGKYADADIYTCGRGDSYFGIFVRDRSYQAYLCNYHYGRDPVVLARLHELDYRDYDPGGDWHTYRVEVRGNELRFLVDGTVLLEAADNRILTETGGDIGLVCGQSQINIRSFKVIAL